MPKMKLCVIFCWNVNLHTYIMKTLHSMRQIENI